VSRDRGKESEGRARSTAEVPRLNA